MRVCVLGAGVVGLTTAWALTEAGCEVVIVDRQPAPGLEASRGNGAQLSYAFVAPLASPETLRHLPALLLDRSGPLRVRLTADPAFWRWGAAFLLACRSRTARETVAAQLQLSALSRQELERIAAAVGVPFGLRVAGKLVVHRDEGEWVKARRASVSGQAPLSSRECLALEPALRIAERDIAGGIYTPSEMVGDCGTFCDGLAAKLRECNSVAWFMGEEARPIARKGRLCAVTVDGVDVAADAFVCALGSGAARFVHRLGVRLPIYPMKGYSLTLRPRSDTPALAHSVTDAARKIVFAPIERYGQGLVRAAGIADLVGYDAQVDPARLDLVRRAAADALDIDWQHGTGEPWTGLRPATPDSRPIIGWSKVPGLFLNTGHGALGWTLAAGSARLTADMLLGLEPQISAAPFGVVRQSATPSAGCQAPRSP